MNIRLGGEEILNLESSLRKEYVLTNGRGGYSSSTVLDCHTRKYHGLLVLPVGAEGRRFNLVSKLDISATVGTTEFQLATNKFPGVFHPTGHQHVEHFDMGNVPAATYRLGRTRISKTILMPCGSDAVLVRISVLESPCPVLIKAMPFLACREIHALMRRNMYVWTKTYPERNGFKIRAYEGVPELFFQTSCVSEFFPAPVWWENFEFREEQNRGYPHREDLFAPGVFEVKLASRSSVVFRAGLSAAPESIEAEWDTAESELRGRAQSFAGDPEPLCTLKAHAQHYIAEDVQGRKGILAGFHWFDEWGRDTMISLAGLTLCRADPETAVAILEKYGAFEKDGLMPNTVFRGSAHSYGCVDSALFYVWAVQHCLAACGDEPAVRKRLLPIVCRVVEAVLDGRNPLARLGSDGLLYAGRPDIQATWMDAIVEGKPVTPRHGAAVEINALWYNALELLRKAAPAETTPPLARKVAEAARRFASSFQRAFWNERTACLLDVYRGRRDRDASIRPNQLFAIGLPFTCVDRDTALRVLRTVREHLITPYGLRTLSPTDPAYQPEYAGDVVRRDRAYHQGMVWPWLVGIYADALARTGTDKANVFRQVQSDFGELWESHLKDYGLFHISEIFEPDPPYKARGCVAQAWSVAEAIRVLHSYGGKNNDE